MHEDYKAEIFDGCSIDHKGASVCNLQDVMPQTGLTRSSPRYQVWSDKDSVYEIYHNIDDAVNKFIELKRKSL